MAGLNNLAPERDLPPVGLWDEFFAAVGRALARSVGIVALLVAWEALARSGAFTPFMLPTLSATLERIWSDAQSGDLFNNLGVTIYRAMAGFAIAAVAGVALGAWMSRINAVRWFFDPIVSVGFPMPKIAFLPIIVLWLGFYDVPKISMVAIEAIFPVVNSKSRIVNTEFAHKGRDRSRPSLFIGVAPVSLPSQSCSARPSNRQV